MAYSEFKYVCYFNKRKSYQNAVKKFTELQTLISQIFLKEVEGISNFD